MKKVILSSLIVALSCVSASVLADTSSVAGKGCLALQGTSWYGATENGQVSAIVSIAQVKPVDSTSGSSKAYSLTGTTTASMGGSQYGGHILSSSSCLQYADSNRVVIDGGLAIGGTTFEIVANFNSKSQLVGTLTFTGSNVFNITLSPGPGKRG